MYVYVEAEYLNTEEKELLLRPREGLLRGIVFCWGL